MKSTNEILKRIREVCGLEKLEFGCEVLSDGEIFKVYTEPISGYFWATDGKKNNTFLVSVLNNQHTQTEIIGLPVELNHLLMAIDFNSTNEKESVSISCNFMRVESYGKSELYNLSLTVEQNLNQNDELRAFISELIFK